VKIVFFGNMNDVHTPKWAQYFIDKKHDVIKIHEPRFSIRGIFRLRNILNKIEPHILHTHYAGAWGLMAVLSRYHPLIITVHGSEVLLTKGIKQWLVKWVLKKADMITTDGYHVKRKMMTMGIDKDKIKIVGFGVDCNKFKPMENKVYPYLVLCRTGNSYIYDTKTFWKAADIVNKYLEENLHYDCDFMEIKNIRPDEMPDCLGKATLYVSCALSDAGLSSTTAEAMACGLPVLVSDIYSNSSFVFSRQYFKPEDYKELADKMIEILNSHSYRKKIGDINRETIINGNNYEVEMLKMENYYKEVVNG